MPGDNQPSPALNTVVRPLPILSVAFAIGLLFDYLLYGKMPGTGFTLFVVAVVIGTAVIARFAHKRLSRTTWRYAMLAVVFAAGVSWRASYELAFMNAALSLFLLLLAVSEEIGDKVRRFAIEKYFSLVWLPFYFLGNIVMFFGAVFSQRNGERTGKARAVIRGILLALPIIVLFTLLFSSADLVFQKYVKDIVNIKISGETLVRSFLVLFAALGFSGAAWFMFNRVRKVEQPSVDVRRTSIGSTEVGILLGSVNLLFLLFIIVQLTYLFGGKSNVVGQGFTFAEYARRGFFELVCVAVISWLVVWALDRTLANGEGKVQRMARLLSAALIVQVFAIMSSAFMRLALYEQAYGFTTLRFYSHAFTVWLAVAFMLLLYKLFVHHREDRLAFSILVIALAFAGAVNVFDPDAFIAKQNIERYSTTGKVDVFYLDQLSPDAVTAMMPMLEVEDVVVANTAAGRFFWKMDRLDRTSRWQSYNVGRRQALKLLQSKRQLLEKNKDFFPSLDFLQTQSIVTD